MSLCGINFLSRGMFKIVFLAVVVSLAAAGQSLNAQMVGEVVVASKFANIRSGPGTKYARLGRAYRGERYSVTDYRPQWYAIMYKGRVAWVYDRLVQFEKTMPSQAEVDQVSSEIKRLNQRLDRVLEKINQTGELLAEQVKQKELAAQEKGRKKGRAEARPAGERVAPALAFVPGGPRIASGQKVLGLSGLAATAGCVAAGFLYHSSYRDYRAQYRALPREALPEQFSQLHDKARSRKRLSGGFFYAAAGLYALNMLDCFFILPRTGGAVQVSAAPAGGQKVHLSLSCAF